MKFVKPYDSLIKGLSLLRFSNSTRRVVLHLEVSALLAVP